MTISNEYQVNSLTDSDNIANLSHRTIGAILVDAGRLQKDRVDDIIGIQVDHRLLFGEAGIKLGLLSQADIDYALSQQFDCPYLIRGKNQLSEHAIAAYDPFTPKVDSLRRLRAQLLHRCFAGGASNTLVMTSAEQGEGRSFILANLAILLAQVGKRTLIIDGDLRRPQQHNYFALPNDTGLSMLLLGRADQDAIQRVPYLPNLSVLPSGPVPPNPQELLLRPLFPQLLTVWGRAFDAVLIDSPPALLHADAAILSGIAQSALLVIRRDKSRLQDTQAIVADMRDKRVTLVGAVMNSP
ncbi:polysaccharide biosynthesis tyrosine autokinase [Noviherbaspirillum malthae]|uniref:polysaccharide biosynthesis tyrosine autokinase n=1 Tax=Noviherbaspirillum malthae TaxID=1260987 RepID=UPI00189054F5|nr:polysaccharide biosynthesis tyrosine autokinase [Noviherbaspirillum malthae]